MSEMLDCLFLMLLQLAPRKLSDTLEYLILLIPFRSIGFYFSHPTVFRACFLYNSLTKYFVILLTHFCKILLDSKIAIEVGSLSTLSVPELDGFLVKWELFELLPSF